MRAELPQTSPLPRLDADQLLFVDDLGQFYARYGVAPSLGRVHGLLLLNDEPVSLDEISARLGVSKTGASVVTRDLERVGAARRRVQTGSRRVLYEATGDMRPVFEAMFARVRGTVAVLRGADGLVSPGRAKDRLQELKAVCEFWLSEGEGILARWEKGRRVS
jgi:DNA-binding MarR family transcriptional regulator